MDFLNAAEHYRMVEVLYAAAYSPTRRSEADDVIEIWPSALAVGTALPVLPLPLGRWRFVPVDLETTYAETCQRMRLV